MNRNLLIFDLFGGVLILLFGVNLAGEGLKGWAGPRMRTALETMTKNRFTALLSGIGITFLLQSSSATSVTLVSLIDSGLLTFTQAIGVILGADVGTAITVQLIAFKIYDYAALICGLGLLVMFTVGDERKKQAGRGLLGFGLILLAIKIMSEAMLPLKDSGLFKEILGALSGQPLLAVIIALVFTALVHSSAAAIGIAITLAVDGLIDLQTAIPLVLGANVGTSATALIASLKSSIGGRRAAAAHTVFKVVGAALALVLLGPFTRLTAMTSSDGPRQIANAHFLFNLGVVLVFLPVTPLVARLIEKWLPEKKEAEEEFKPKYLNPAMLKTPAVALAQASRETLRMAEIVEDMLKWSLPAIMDCDLSLVEKVETMDDRVDLLDRSIRFYLTHLSKAQLNHEEAIHQMELHAVSANLESIGDVIDKNLMELARKKARKCVQFSPDGKKDIEDLHARVLENFQLAVSAFTANDRGIAERVMRNKSRLRELEREYSRRHLERLESGLSEAFETSSIHLDILTNLKRINAYLTSIIYPILDSRPPA